MKSTYIVFNNPKWPFGLDINSLWAAFRYMTPWWQLLFLYVLWVHYRKCHWKCLVPLVETLQDSGLDWSLTTRRAEAPQKADNTSRLLRLHTTVHVSSILCPRCPAGKRVRICGGPLQARVLLLIIISKAPPHHNPTPTYYHHHTYGHNPAHMLVESEMNK